MDEMVALYDEWGRPVGSAPRSRMRAENLRHAATAVVVRDPYGRVYVHRRTDTKDVYPGRFDFAAGGVLHAGEDPLEGARREAEEELGVTGELVSLGEGDYADDHTTYHGFLYETEWDGPVRLQAEEVASGDWLTMERLAEMIEDPRTPVMPDTVGLLGGWVRDRLADRTDPGQGWDSVATLVEGRWIDRTPRRPEVARTLRTEAALLPRIADLLPLEVPRPVVLEEEPLRVRHALVRGAPADAGSLSASDGQRVGEFLRVLHGLAPAVWAGCGVPDPEETWGGHLRLLAEMRERVLPLLPADLRPAGEALLEDLAERGPEVLVHGDLGPEHLLSAGGRVSGVIDWGDCRVHDPALDLAWTLFGTSAAFADALASAYGVTPELRRRGRARHRFGPWFEAHFGLSGGPAEYVDSGLAGVVARLRE